MLTLNSIVLMLTPVILGSCIWFSIYNNRAFDQRREIVPKVDDPLFYEKLAAFRTVTYYSHVWALFFFKNPIKLYPEILHGTK